MHHMTAAVEGTEVHVEHHDTSVPGMPPVHTSEAQTAKP